MKCNVKDQDGRLRKTRKLGLSLEMPFFFCPPPPFFKDDLLWGYSSTRSYTYESTDE